ncbi:MAG TPA: sulfate permease [Acidimicrobiia bacterium]|nr:sulfate permease [Acidimicrobiia bacterium]
MSTGAGPGRLARAVPILDWLPHYRRADLRGDAVAGLTGAAILVPQSMAYATIAGLPPIVGLYASVVPVLVYAVLGSSPQLSVGPLATISIIAAVALAKLAPTGSAEYVALAASLAVLVGGVHLALGWGRLGFLVRFLSEPVMGGFIGAVGVIIITTQLGPLFGYSVPLDALPIETVWGWIDRLDQTSAATLAVSVPTLVVLLLLRRYRRFPTALVAIVGWSLAAYAFDLERHGVAVVGHVPQGLAGPQWPSFSWHEVRVLLPAALAITFVGFVESLAIEREYAREHGTRVDANHELVALGSANVAAGLFQGMIVTGAVTRSSIVDAAGARTQLSGAITALVVAPLLVFWTDGFSYIPVCVLAVIVIVAVIGFVHIGEAQRLWRVQRTDFWLMIGAFVSTVGLGVEVGVLLAVAASIVVVVYRATNPRVPELGRLPGTDALVELARHPEAERFTATVIVRPESPLYFTNADTVDRHLRAALERDGTVTLVVDMSGVDELDATADHMLREVVAAYLPLDRHIWFVHVHDDVRDVMDASGLAALVGDDAFLATDHDTITRLESP